MSLPDEIAKVARQYTPEHFAVLAGCSTSTMYRWLRGEAVPRSESHLQRLAKLGVSRTTMLEAREARPLGRPTAR